MRRAHLEAEPVYFRSDPVRGAPKSVDTEKGVIRGCAAVTRGEALGHGLWLDDVFLGQVEAALRDKSANGLKGLKSRYTHPSLSGDGLADTLGRCRGGSRDADSIRTDLHIGNYADKSPKGKIGSHVLAIAAEDSEQFGLSIVFKRDLGAEDAFAGQHSNEDGDFSSPDTSNVRNLRHARLASLHAVDVVGDPAANPTGLFSESQDVAVRADAALSYLLGLTDDQPAHAVETFGIHPERARSFVQRTLKAKGLAIRPTSGITTFSQEAEVRLSNVQEISEMADQPENVTPPQAPAAIARPASLADLKAAFPGPDLALFPEMCQEQGLSLPASRQALTEKERDEARQRAEAAEKRLAEIEQAGKLAASEGVLATSEAVHVTPGTARFGEVEVGQSRVGTIALDNNHVRRIFAESFSETLATEKDVDAAIAEYQKADKRRKRFDAKFSLNTSAEMEDSIRRASRDMLMRSGDTTGFAMGVSGPDYANIVVKGIIGTFYKSMTEEFARSWASEVMWLNTESNQETETYRWLGQAPQLREWLGGRQLLPPGINTFSITNKTYEATLPVSIEDWRFDKTGQLAVRFGDLAQTHIDHWHSRITTQLTTNGLCYDGQNYFDTDHTAADLAESGGDNSSTYVNAVTNSHISELNATTPPTRDEIVDVVLQTIAYFRNYQDNFSRPYNDGIRRVVFMTPPSLDAQFMAAIRDQLRNSGSTNTVAAGSQRYNSTMEIDHIPNSRLTGSTVFYAFRTDSRMKPFIGQEPVMPEFTFLGAGSDHAFKHNQYLGGMKAVREADYGQWAHAIQATLS